VTDLQRREALIEDSHEVPPDPSNDLYVVEPADTALHAPQPGE
jgi:hypothetical protein